MAPQFCLTCEVDTGYRSSGHLTHENHILLFQKARMAYLAQFGYTEQNIEGFRVFIVEVGCTYKRELFLRDKIEIRCRVDDIRDKIFSMSYTIERDEIPCASGFSRSACVDPDLKKAVLLPKAFVAKIRQYEGLELP